MTTPIEMLDVIEIKNTANTLPQYDQHVAVWNPIHNLWMIGTLQQGRDSYGDFFNLYNFGARYLIDGPVWWFMMPPDPTKPVEF